MTPSTASRLPASPMALPDIYTLATKTDLKTEISLLRSELKTEISGLRSELKLEISDLRTELKTDIAGLRTFIASSQVQTLAITLTSMAAMFTLFKLIH
jgi:hypothetical protein